MEDALRRLVAVKPHSRPETLAQIEERICSCGSGHGSGEGHTGWCDFTDYQALPPRPAEPAQAGVAWDYVRREDVLEILDLAEHDAEERDWRSGANEIARLIQRVRSIPSPVSEYERKLAQLKKDFPNGI